MKKTIAIIGLGTFGGTLARRLYQNGHEVIAVDRDREQVQEMHDGCNQAVVADATDRETMSAIGLDDVDAAVVSLGDAIEPSTLATLYLKEFGVKQIIVKAVSADHEKVLRLVGASEIVYPERDTALRVADRMSSPNVLEKYALSAGFSMVEVKAPKDLWGKTLKDSEVRKNYGVAIVSMRVASGTTIIAPSGNDRIEEGGTLWVIGTDADVEKFKKLL